MTSKNSKRAGILVASAIAMAATMGVAGSANAAEMEKCYGVTKAGKNDCQVSGGSCAGTAKMDRSGKHFVAVPKGTCDKLAGGTTTSM